ncbi:hypothetical protein J4223_03255 [Candidatus Woesearchaeota archaeon]|nr:hypothetical protein [Candidatus Woesearchaeota archaeon]
MFNYVEIYYRQKETREWSTARGILDCCLEGYADSELLNGELLNNLVARNPGLEFDQNYLLLTDVDFTELGRYELDPLFAKPEIKNNFGFINRNDLGWKSLEELTEEVFVPSPPNPPMGPREDIPF